MTLLDYVPGPEKFKNAILAGAVSGDSGTIFSRRGFILSVSSTQNLKDNGILSEDEYQEKKKILFPGFRNS